jgi:uncharacterized repeat protein (TIGR01451 family)/LPXTG-motif cell wall-anchored protein
MAKPADHVTFNSITDNPNIGDERNFVGIREAGSSNKWFDTMNVQEGKEYIVRMYVHNNAAANLKLVAKNVTAKVYLPTNTAKSLQVNGFVNSSNAKPVEVYDHAIFTSDQNFNLAYVKGTLKFENNSVGKNGGVALPESIFTSSGAKLGYSKLDGNIPGCIQYAGYVSFTVKPQFAKPNTFTMSKKVSKHGAKQWVENYKATPGETVDYLIEYKNTGQAVQNDVVVRDTLPANQTYVNGSTTFYNSNNPNGKTASDNIANGVGINIGSYGPGANAKVIFSAKIADKDKLECGDTKMINSAKVNISGVSISDTAEVVVTKDCDKPKEPVFTCDALSAKLISGTKYQFKGEATALNGASIKNYRFDFGDSSNETTTSSTTTHTYAANKNATYTAKLTVAFNVDGKEKTATSKACEVTINTSKKPPVTPPEVSETPSELPTTGIGANVSALLGLGSLITSVSYYRASRRRV